jgi:cell division protein FtsL
MKKISSKLEIVGNFINNLLHKQNLIIFIGKVGIKIIACYKHQAIDNIFVSYEKDDHFQVCCTFLKNYKKFQVLVLLDSPTCQIKHEFIPMLQSIIKSNPIEKFIQDNYNSDDIVAYTVHNIDANNAGGEVWQTVIASSPYITPTSQVLEFVIYNSFGFNGIYFLSLEFESIVDTILAIKHTPKVQNDLQIFVTITETSGIRIATKYKKNILDELTISFPSDKSDLYIVGTIEQAISDKILKYKTYATSLDLKVCIIFLCNKALCDIFERIPSFQTYNIITYSDNILPLVAENKYQSFQDNKLLELFIENKKHLASNQLLKSITKLTNINSVMFKPLSLVIIGIIVFLIYLKYNSIVVQQETIELNNKYYSFSEKYRTIKKRHPEVENITNLTDFYNLQTILSIKSPNPFDFLEKLFSLSNNPSIKIVNIDWYTEDTDFTDKKIILSTDIYIMYIGDKKNEHEAQQVLQDYVSSVRLLFPDYQVSYSIEYDHTTELLTTLTIPAKLTISKNIEGS